MAFTIGLPRTCQLLGDPLCPSSRQRRGATVTRGLGCWCADAPFVVVVGSISGADGTRVAAAAATRPRAGRADAPHQPRLLSPAALYGVHAPRDGGALITTAELSAQG